MMFTLVLVAAQLVATWLVSVYAFPSPSLDTSNYVGIDRISRDICIIGGGAGGTYAAIQLRKMGKTVVVVEKESHLGGHTKTYRDPTTGVAVDYGVILFHNEPFVKDYFAHFNIPLAPLRSSDVGGQQIRTIDLRTGQLVNVSIPGNITAAALGRYADQLAKYPYLDQGFDLPDPVPEDLLLPFGKFVEKYDLKAAVPTIADFVQGTEDVLASPTIYILKYFSRGTLEGVMTTFLSTAQHNNSALYDAARNELGEDVFFNSVVHRTWITSDKVHHVEICTPEGFKRITASKLLIAMPPKIENLQGFDLDHTQTALFSRFRNASYYATLIRHSGIPDGVQIVNRAADTLYALPKLPAPYIITPTAVSGLNTVFYGAVDHLSSEQVKRDVTANILRLRNANISTTPPEFVEFADHTPYELVVSAQHIANGFYKCLNNLQGYRNIWYTGAAFQTHDSTLVWKFTAAVLQKMFPD